MSKSTPGTYTTNGVRCTMDAPFSKAAGSRTGSAGEYGANHAPFDKPQNTGNGGIPTKFFDTGMGASKATTVNAGMTGTAGVNVTAPVGQRRFRNPK